MCVFFFFFSPIVFLVRIHESVKSHPRMVSVSVYRGLRDHQLVKHGNSYEVAMECVAADKAQLIQYTSDGAEIERWEKEYGLEKVYWVGNYSISSFFAFFYQVLLAH